MKIIDKIANEQRATIAFFGDSVTQGCFECFIDGKGAIDTVFENKNAYGTRVKEILNMLYPKARINVINAGISGDSAVGGYKRIDRDVLSFNPDLVVVAFGLNDSCSGESGLDTYLNHLKKIFKKLKDKNIETVFLMQNNMATEVSPHLNKAMLDTADLIIKTQTDGILKTYFNGAKKVCKEYGITVCDMFGKWESMAKNGVETTELLANRLNHPEREMHYYTAIKLIETFFEN